MRVGIIGTGNMGSAIGGLLSQRGHEVVLGSRDPGKRTAHARTAGTPIRIGTIREAAQEGEAILVAVHFAVIGEVLAAAGPLAGKILMDCTNPLTADFMNLTVGHTTSAGEEIARLRPEARVVKVFNHNLSQALTQLEHRGVTPAAFYCGDDPIAKRRVADIVRDLGLDPIDAGPLACARYLEPMAELLIRLAYAQGMGATVRLALLRS